VPGMDICDMPLSVAQAVNVKGNKETPVRTAECCISFLRVIIYFIPQDAIAAR